jgi:hypothetical protein
MSPGRRAVSRFLTLEPRQLDATASSFDNDLSHRLPSWAETKALNLHHHCRPPSPDSPTPTLHCYKNVISTLATLPTTQPRLHFASSLVRAPRHRSSTHHRRSLSPLSHAHRSSARHPQWRTSRPSFASRTAYRYVNSRKNIKLVINYLWIIFFIMARL